MDQLTFQLVPNKIPLGKAVDATITVSCTNDDAIEDVWGRLDCASGVKVVGDGSVNILRIKPSEKIDIPIRIKGTSFGKTRIIISKLSANTDGGIFLEINPIELEIEVTSLDFDPSEISFILKSTAPIPQNVITKLVCRVHNNSPFPIEIMSIDMSTRGSDVYNSPDGVTGRTVQPGAGFSFDIQILPKSAGDISIFLNSCFKIQDQIFSQTTTFTIVVVPSSQPDSQVLLKSIRTILVITSAPNDKQTIRTDRELKKILFEMKHSAKLRDDFQVEILPAATAEELSREIITYHPYIVHFAGHGTHEGIILEDDSENSSLFPTYALVNLLRPLSDQVECVILNACDSLAPAREIAKNIQFVVGMRQEVYDDAALVFARTFYEAIGAGYSIEKAFQLGKAVLSSSHLEESEIPTLVTRH